MPAAGGCVGGVLTVENPYVAEVKLKHLRKYMPVARSHMDAETEEKAEELMTWTQSVEYEPVYNLGETMMESFARLSRIEVLSKQLPGTGLRSLRRAVLQGTGRGHCPGSGEGRGLRLYYERTDLAADGTGKRRTNVKVKELLDSGKFQVIHAGMSRNGKSRLRFAVIS